MKISIGVTVEILTLRISVPVVITLGSPNEISVVSLQGLAVGGPDVCDCK